MNLLNSLSAKPWRGFAEEYLALFAASGAEERASFIAQNRQLLVQQKVAMFYDRDNTPVVKKNHSTFARMGFSGVALRGEKLRADIRAIVRSATETEPAVPICVDISCLTREAIALWIFELLTAKLENRVLVDFLYSHAQFSPPPVHSGLAKEPSPVIPEFAGFFSKPYDPALLLIGIGYEPFLALYFAEYLEPAKVIAFVPQNHDRRYTSAISRENQLFFESIRKKGTVMNYDVFDPFETLQKLESTVSGAMQSYRVNIVPYGPKVFILASLIVAAMRYPGLFVWHLDSKRELPPENRRPSGKIGGIRLEVSSQ